MKIPPEIFEFLQTQRVCVFALEMLDGSPHGAAMHFAHVEEPFTFIFQTDRVYRKSEALLGKSECRATLVIGFEEGKQSKTFQLDGIAQNISENETDLKEKYFEKFPKKKAKDGPESVFFKFTPTWWRFTDWSGPEGKKVLHS